MLPRCTCFSTYLPCLDIHVQGTKSSMLNLSNLATSIRFCNTVIMQPQSMHTTPMRPAHIMHTTPNQPLRTADHVITTESTTHTVSSNVLQTFLVSAQLTTVVLGSIGNAMIIVVMRQPEFKTSMTSLYFIALSGKLSV